ncbi:MAG: histidine kinase dimerization/phospho-acceptor domain-containing protein, partial [Burkholderiales bacterium]
MRIRSIRGALIGLFTAIVFATIAIASAALYLELKRELTSRQSEELLGKLDLIRHLAADVKGEGDWNDFTRIIDDIVIGHGQLRVWIGPPGGAALYGGRSMPPTVAAGEFNVNREDGVTLRAVAGGFPSQAAAPDTRIIVALDERSVERTLTQFRLALGAVTLLSVLAAAGLGAFVVGRCLAPVRRLAEQSAMIDPTQLSTRLGTDELPAELRELGSAFNGVLERLELSYRQMESFNADVAHELRSPLTNLIGGTQLALARERDGEFYRDILASNLEEFERLKTIVNDMMFLARADRGDRVD